MATVEIPTRELAIGQMLVNGRKSEKITKIQWGRKFLHVVVNDKYRYDRAGKAEVRL